MPDLPLPDGAGSSSFDLYHVFGTEMNEACRWITIPWIDKTFQTSDFAEIALILFLAKSLATKQEYIKDFKSAFCPSSYR